MVRALIPGVVVLLLNGCSLWPDRSGGPAATLVTVPVEETPSPPAWVLEPVRYGTDVRGYEKSVRQALIDDALTEIAADYDLATHTRLALLLDNAVITLREHLETVVKIEHILDSETPPDAYTAAVLQVQLNRLNSRVAMLQNLAAANKRGDRLRRQVSELESSQSETEAALEVAQEKIEALKSIEHSLRRE